MTVSTTTARIAYTGNGVTTAFTIPFKFLTNADIATYVDGVLQATGVTITGAGGDTGTATFAVAPASLTTVVIVRAQINDQQTDLPANGPFPAQSVETMSDKAMIGIQQVNDAVQLAIRAPTGDTSTLASLPLAASRLDRLLGFNITTGQPEVSPFTMTQVASTVAAVYAGSAGPLDALTFLAAGTGAVARTAQAKLREVSISVKDFGAAGDGVTDDTTKIQAALTAAGANGTVYFPGGTYVVSATLTGYANQTLRGAGSNSTLIKRTGNYGDTIVFGSAAASCGHICIESMWFKHGSGDYVPGVNSIPDKATSGAHIRLWDSQSSILNDVWIWRLPYGVVYEGGSFGMLDKCHFYSIWDPLYTAAQEGIAQVLYRKSTVGGIPTSMKIRGSYLTGAAALARATDFSPSTGVVSKNITALVGSQYGVQINCCEDFEMTGCYSSGQSQNTVLVNNTVDPALELRFYGNFFDCAGQAILQFSPGVGAGVSYVNVTGNTFNGEDTGLYAINFGQAGATFGTHSSSVTGNQFLAFVGAEILAAGLAKSLIAGNTFAGYNDLNVTPSDPSYCAAVYVTGASLDVTVNNNVVGYGNYCYQGIVFSGGLVNIVQYDNINAGAIAFGPQTPPSMMNVVSVNTQLGLGAPVINMKKVTGTTNAAQGAGVSVAHGLTASKIIGIQPLVTYAAGQAVDNGFTIAAGYEFHASVNGANIDVSNKAANSINILSKPFSVLITYEA